MEKAIAQSSVNDMFDLLEGKNKVIIDPEKVDFGFFKEHKPYKQIPKNANIPLRGIMLPHQSVSGNTKYIKQNGRIKLVSHLR